MLKKYWWINNIKGLTTEDGWAAQVGQHLTCVWESIDNISVYKWYL